MAADGVDFANERQAPVERHVARGNHWHLRKIRITEGAKPLRRQRFHRGIHQAAPLQLRQKVAGIIRRVSVTKHIQIKQHEPVCRPQELPGRHVAMHGRGLGRIKPAQGLVQSRHQRLDNFRGLRPAQAQAITTGARLVEEHLGRGQFFRNDRQAMQVGGQPGGQSQRLRFSIIYYLRQELALHPGENEHVLLRHVADCQTNPAKIWLAVLRQGLGMGPHALDKIIRIELQRINEVSPVVRAQAHLRHETVRMNALQGASNVGRVEAGGQNRAQNLQHRSGLLEPHHLRPQGDALLGNGFESEAHTFFQ